MKHFTLQDIDSDIISPDKYVWYKNPKFNEFVSTTFEKYRKVDIKKESCDVSSIQMELFSHQKFIRDYMQYKSPYRGLLVYHGLGVGKTCTSIAAAELLMNFKKVCILLPASLQTNFIEEIRKCGNKYYNIKNYHWTFYKHSKVNYISENTLNKNQGVWFIDESKSPNIDKLSTDEIKSLELQINDVIHNNYEFINYNGLSSKRMNELTNDNKTNPFDNKVIIVDEVHNLVSNMTNEKNKIGPILFNLLMKAKNIKIILLSGTPIINHPFEVAYIVNLIKGLDTVHHIKCNEKNEHVLNNILQSIPDIYSFHYVFEKYTTINISLNPFGFKKENNHLVFTNNAISDKDCIQKIQNTLAKQNIKIKETSKTDFLPLPTDQATFSEYFIKDDNITNTNLFMRRILGSISYFVSDNDHLYPSVKIVDDDIEMSDYQYEKYKIARKEEYKLESKTSKKKKNNSDVPSVYKTYSRTICNFVFPKSIDRPKPKDFDNSQSNDKKKEYDKEIEKILNKLSKSHLTEELNKLSPKFAKIVENVTRSPGNVLIYSQFNSVEGIKILSMIMKYNGYDEMKIDLINGEWIVTLSSKPMYIQFNTEIDPKHKSEYTNILLNIYNNEFSKLPSGIKKQLKGKTNLRGELLKILFITQSGAEGISLKNVRQVHVTEPYWNKNRIDQVIGRANRTCSHFSLPKNERNFTVYRYTMKFTTAQKNQNDMIISRHDKLLSTDQIIYQIASRKAALIDQFLQAMKNSSVDCNLNKYTQCMAFPIDISNNHTYSFDIEKDVKDHLTNQSTKTFKKKPVKITLKKYNKTYLYLQDTNELFDYNLYITHNILSLVGYLEMIDGNAYMLKLIN